MTVNPIGNRFCESCGFQLQAACARCGHGIAQHAHYCGNCGTSLVLAAAARGERPASPKWGELKQATVLFADIVGSTELVANLDPEQAMGRLRPAILVMRHSVERFGGTVARTLGDGVMALFGVPHALEGHALLACQAALHMHRAFSQEPNGLPIRIGLHSGQVASDPEDAQDGRGGGAHGLTIHLASRVAALAPPGAICLTEPCRIAAGPGCQAESMGLHHLKGIAQPVELLRLGGVQTGARRHGTAQDLPSTFRGRGKESARLLRALGELGTAPSRVIGVSGDPGAGKTRLCAEFATLCRQRHVPVFEVRAQLYGHALPLQPVLELFRTHFFGIGPGDDAGAARARIARRFEALQPAAADLALLNEFFGVVEAGAAPAGLGPRARQARLIELLKSLVRLDAQVQRVIVIEDLHWLDEASEDFVSALVQAVEGTHTLLLLNYRPSYRAPWASNAGFEEMPLGELPADDLDAMVHELLAPFTAAPEVAALVRRRSAGNPFFAEELVRAIVDGGLLAADTGLPVGGLQALESGLPPTVQAVISARLDRVGEPEKTLLQMCAIIGKDIPLAVLERVASPLAIQIALGLEGLCRAGLILPQPSSGGRQFSFRHPLIQEVAYGTQLRVRRGQVHASVAEAMEIYYADQLGEYGALIGYHYEEAAQHLPAARYNALAAAWVGSTNAAQAIKHWRKVRRLLEAAVRGTEVDRLRVTAGAKIALLGWREGLSFEEVKPLIDESLALANEIDDRLVPWLLTVEGRMLVASGGPADAYVDSVRKALLCIDIDRDAGRVGLAHAFLGQAFAWAGLLNEALAACDVALANASFVDLQDREFMGFNLEQWILGVRARLLVRMGRLPEACGCLGRLVELEATSSEPPVPGLSRFALVELAWARSDTVAAQGQARELAALALRHAATPYVHAFMQGYRGIALATAGEPAAALQCYGAALQLVRDTGAAREFEPEILAGMAECLVASGHYAQARENADQAIDLSLARSTRIAQLRALMARGMAAAALPGETARTQAQADFARAQALIEETGAISWSPFLIKARQGLDARVA